MRKSGILIFAALAAVVYYFFGQKQAAKNLKVYFSGLDIKKPTGFTLPEFIARFQLINPASANLTITNITGEIFVNKKQFAVVNSVEKITVPGNSKKEYKIKLTVPAVSAITSILNLFRAGEKLEIIFAGSVNSNGVLLPLKQIIYTKQS